MIPAFEPGNPIRLPVSFTSQSTPVDPTSVTLRITDPTGHATTQTYPAGNIIRDSMGQFHYDLEPPLPSGSWTYRYMGDPPGGTVIADTGDIEFTILPSVFA